MEEVTKPENTGGSWGLTDDFVKSALKRILPASVVDFGCGLGKYGFLVREILGGVKTVAVDVFPKTTDWLSTQNIYNEVVNSDIREYEGGGHLGIFGDVLEHLPEEDIKKLLLSIFVESRFKYLIIVVPLGEVKQGAEGGNEAERHLSTIEEKKFVKMIEDIGYRIVERYVVSADVKNGFYYKMSLTLKL